MGEVPVPDDAYYGASTQRAVDNFPISGIRFSRRFIWALGVIKGEAAKVNASLGIIEPAMAEAIAQAAAEVEAGDLDSHFPLDIFQTGSGTSTNTNANEVIANRASQILGGELGSKLVHPNDGVNPSQSSNDVIPTAIHLAALKALHEDTIPALDALADTLEAKAAEFDHILKSGRTHLMDATPVRLGQEFGGYAAMMRKGAARLRAAAAELCELPLGGTAVGTGINAPPGFAAGVIAAMAERTGWELREADDHFEAQGAKDAAVNASGALRTVAVSMFKVANDLRWLASGPRSSIAEIKLPELQPGSSIMPGKVNPVICEMVMMVAAQAIGNDATVAWSGANGNFELNVMMPVLAHNLVQSAELLGSAADVLREKAVEGLVADEQRTRELLERNIIVVTALAPKIGYDLAAKVAKEAFATGRTVREVALEMEVLPPNELDASLDVRKMTEGGIVG
jgi:fumarate hydratase class II